MTNNTLFNKIVAIVSTAIMIQLAIFQLIAVGLLASEKIILSKADIIPSFFKDLVSVYNGIHNYSMIFIICLIISSICLIISAVFTIMPIIRTDSVPRGSIVFQKISCIFAFALLIAIAFIGFMSIYKYGFLVTSAYGFFCYMLYLVHALVITLLFILSSNSKTGCTVKVS